MSETPSMDAVTVTAVIPAFNEEANIVRLTRQVLDEPWTAQIVLQEVIIVDDCSDDGTKELTERLARDHQRVRVIRHTRRCGKNAGMRTGLAACHSGIIVFVDADVLLARGCLIKTVQLLAVDPSIVAASALHQPLPPRSWRERASRCQAIMAAEIGRLGHGCLARVYALRIETMRAITLPDTLPDDFFIMRWLHDRGYRFGVRTDAIFYVRPATGLRDFGKQTLRIWQAGWAVEQAMPGPGLPPRPRSVTTRAIARAFIREPVGFALYAVWRLFVTVTPPRWWVAVVDHSRYDTSLSTKDLGQ